LLPQVRPNAIDNASEWGDATNKKKLIYTIKCPITINIPPEVKRSRIGFFTLSWKNGIL